MELVPKTEFSIVIRTELGLDPGAPDKGRNYTE